MRGVKWIHDLFVDSLDRLPKERYNRRVPQRVVSGSVLHPPEGDDPVGPVAGRTVSVRRALARPANTGSRSLWEGVSPIRPLSTGNTDRTPDVVGSIKENLTGSGTIVTEVIVKGWWGGLSTIDKGNPRVNYTLKNMLGGR